MSATNKTIGGVSIIGLIVFSVITINRNSRRDEIRNAEMKSHYELQESIKESLKQGESTLKGMKLFTEGYIDLKDSSKCNLNPYKLNSNFKLNASVSYPCRWQKLDEVKNVSLVAQYANIITDTAMVAISINVNDMGKNMGEDFISKLRSEKFLRKALTDQGHTFISFKNMEVNKVKADEVYGKYFLKGGVMYFRKNHFYYKKYVLTCTYFTTCSSEKSASRLFNDYSKVFDRLRDRTRFY